MFVLVVAVDAAKFVQQLLFKNKPDLIPEFPRRKKWTGGGSGTHDLSQLSKAALLSTSSILTSGL